MATGRVGPRTGAALVGVVLTALSGCDGGGGDAVAATSGGNTATLMSTTSATSTPAAPTSSAPQPAPSAEPVPAPPEPAQPPAETVLVGTWSSVDQGRGQFVHELRADGSFAWVGVNLQLRPSGTSRLTVRAEGTYGVRGDLITLTPTRATRTREDPGDPAGDYVDAPYELAAWSVQWSVDAADRLLLTDSTGRETTYVRLT